MTLLDSEKVWVMPLCDIPLEPSYKNPVYFDESGVLNDGTYKSPSRATFFEKYDSDFDTSGTGYQEVNFELGDTINTSVTLEINDTHKLNANYLHVIWSKVSESSSLKKLPNNLFYFVKSVKQLTTTTFKYQLELDVITTFSPYLHIRGNKPLFTERKHCNRWEGFKITGLSNDKILAFKTGAKADVILGDDIDGRFTAEKLVSNTELEFNFSNFDEDNLYSQAFNIKEAKLWLYVFVLRSDDHNYSTFYQSYTGADLSLPFATFVAPLVSGGNVKVYHNETGNVTASTIRNLNAFALYNKYVDDVNLIGIRISNVSPFNSVVPIYARYDEQPTLSGKTIFTIDDTNLGGSFPYDNYFLHPDGYFKVQSLQYSIFNNTPQTAYLENTLPTFNYTDFTLGDNKNNIYEPKLYTTPFYRYGLKLQGSDIKDYDKIMAFDNGFDDGKVTKQGVVSPDSQKVFYSIDSGVYKDLYKSNIGLTFNPAYSLPMVNDVYKNFLATQNNQQITSLAFGILGGTTQAITGGMMAGLSGKNMSGVVKGTGTATSGIMGVGSSIAGYFAKRQDMKNAPDSISKMGQNVIADVISDNYQECYVIEYDLVDKEKEMVADYFYENGYKVNRECVFSWDLSLINPDDYLITRTLFNFVMINDESFINNLQAYEVSGVKTYTYTLSPAQRNMIGSIFAKGVCLWTLYGITSGNDIEKYYLSKQYENVELEKIIEDKGTNELITISITSGDNNLDTSGEYKCELVVNGIGVMIDFPVEAGVKWSYTQQEITQLIYNKLIGNSSITTLYDITLDLLVNKIYVLAKNSGAIGGSLQIDFEHNDANNMSGTIVRTRGGS